MHGHRGWPQKRPICVEECYIMTTIQIYTVIGVFVFEASSFHPAP